MTAINELKELGLICWSTLLVGQRKGWVSKSDIADYAVSLLADENCENEDIAVLASANTLDDSEVKDLLQRMSRSVCSDTEVLDKWRLAILIALNNSELSEDEKVDRLQEFYAEFDYPEDMNSCSIYSQDTVDPLSAMREVIGSLKQQLAH